MLNPIQVHSTIAMLAKTYDGIVAMLTTQLADTQHELAATRAQLDAANKKLENRAANGAAQPHTD